jgi:hypothetical protein
MYDDFLPGTLCPHTEPQRNFPSQIKPWGLEVEHKLEYTSWMNVVAQVLLLWSRMSRVSRATIKYLLGFLPLWF